MDHFLLQLFITGFLSKASISQIVQELIDLNQIGCDTPCRELYGHRFAGRRYGAERAGKSRSLEDLGAAPCAGIRRLPFDWARPADETRA